MEQRPVGGKLQRQRFVFVKTVGHQFGQPYRMEQARRHPSGKSVSDAGEDRQGGPERIAGGGVRVAGQRVEKQIGASEPSQMIRLVAERRENEPRRVDAAGLRLLAKIGGREVVRFEQP